jgi:WD40 repeat protein
MENRDEQTHSAIMAVLLLSALITCTSAPRPIETSQPPETATVSPAELTAARATAIPNVRYTAVHDRRLGFLVACPQNERAASGSYCDIAGRWRVLIAGGFREEGTSEVPIASAEIYDSTTNTFTPTGDLNEARDGHTATLLPDGQVLIVGGWNVKGRTATAELYDPQTGKFRYAASMSAPRQGMTATLLRNGKVLIAGGDSARNTPQLTAELYDPATNTFTQTVSLNSGRSVHSATLLDDGNVLLVGGVSQNNMVLAGAEIYQPLTGKFTLTGSMSMIRYKHAAVLLQDGNVLVIGGSNQNDWQGKYASAEIYDARAGTFTRTADLNRERFKLADAAVLLNNGNVLVGGGNRQIEIFDTHNQHFLVGDSLDNAYYSSVATRLKTGSVLITGGYDSKIQPSDKAWIYS